MKPKNAFANFSPQSIPQYYPKSDKKLAAQIITDFWVRAQTPNQTNKQANKQTNKQI